MKKKTIFLIKCILTVLSLFSVNYVCDLSINKFYINSVFIPIFAILIGLLIFRYFEFKLIKNKSTVLFIIIISMFSAIFNVFGYNLYTIHTIDLVNYKTYLFIVGLFSVYYSLYNYLFLKIPSYAKQAKKIQIGVIDKLLYEKHTLIKCFIIIIIAWIPIMLAFYPGNFGYDAPAEYLEFYNGIYKGGHPFVHELMIGWCFKLGYRFFDSYNTGVFIYTVLQMIIVAFTMAYIISFLNKRKVCFLYKTFFLGLFMLLPTHSMMVVTSTRDVLFSCAMVLFFIKFYCFYFESEYSIKKGIKYIIDFVILLLLAFWVLAARTNGIYGYVFMLPFVLIPLRRRWKSLLLLNILLFSSFYLYNKCIIDKYRMEMTVEEGIGIQYIIPLQQLARVYPNATDEEKQEMDFFMNKVNETSGWYSYLPRRADAVFVPANKKNITENTERFWNLYLKIGQKYSLTYVDAVFDSTAGYWYIGEILPEKMRPYIEIKCHEPFGITNDQIKFESKIPYLYDLYNGLVLKGDYQYIPIVYILMSTAFNNVLFVSLLILLICKRKINKVTPYMLFVGIMGTYLVCPTCILRYMYFIYIGMPIFIYFVYKEIKDDVIKQ